MTMPVAVVLAAGSGTRLRPLTDLRPKALCPVGNVALVDHAINRVAPVVEEVAVNAWHFREQMVEHLDGRVRLSVEVPDPLGTAGALGALRDWVDGRDVLVHNADAWHAADIENFVDGWDRERPRLLVVEDHVRPDFGTWRFCGVSLLPWALASKLQAVRSGLWAACWAEQWRSNHLEVVPYTGEYFDCGTPASYLAANLLASGGENVIGPGSIVDGSIERCVIWPNSKVRADEHLVDAIRIGDDITVDASSE